MRCAHCQLDEVPFYRWPSPFCTAKCERRAKRAKRLVSLPSPGKAPAQEAA